MDSSGNLYGTTEYGRRLEATARFSSWPRAAARSPRWLRSTAPTVQTRLAGLIMDSSGNLYGTTQVEAPSTTARFSSWPKGSGTITTLASFNGTNGADPYAGLIMDSSGNLYGTTSAGGASNDGTVFELAQGSGTITTLASFNGTDGRMPVWRPDHGQQRQSLRHDRSLEAPTGDGTVFELAKGSGTITTLASFNGTNGADPHAGLIMDSSGNLYGTTTSGGATERTARFSSWPRAAARSPRWLRSTAPTARCPWPR